MKNKFLFMFVALALLLTACGPKAIAGASDSALINVVSTAQPEVLPTVVVPATATLVPTPEPPLTFEGYWLEMVQEVKNFNVPERSQTLRLLYEKNGEVTEIATFCVHGSFWNTRAGVWFIISDNATVYPSAPKGYKQTVFPHNFVWRYQDGANTYLHPAPWNDRGPAGCPIFVSHGCINMRPQDFDVLYYGGDYTNPLTGQVSKVPPINVGTPLVIVPKAEDCTSLGSCLQLFKMASGHQAFAKYTCENCPDTDARWQTLLAIAPILSTLDK